MSGRLIGLGGRMGAGKDVVADRLVEAHGFIKVGMSDPLLNILLITDPWVPVNAHDLPQDGHSQGHFVRASWLVAHVGYVEAKKNPEVRRLLQMIGDNAGRRVHGENVWVDYHARTIAPALKAGTNVVLTGVRYPNELDMVEELGGETVYVDRPGGVENSQHASENSLGATDFGVRLRNVGSVADLQRLVDEQLTGRTAGGYQNVLVDGSVLMRMPVEQPGEPDRAIVESYATGPLVVERSRLSVVV